MNKEVENFLGRFVQVIRECIKFCFLTRGKEFQEESINELMPLKEEAASLKEATIQANDENSSNMLLSIECLIDAVIYELKMWLALKDDDPNKAWDLLIDAQDFARRSCQAGDIPNLNLQGYVDKLSLLEQLLFPPQTYMSPSMLIEGAKCSICGKDYDKCEHVIGKAYMGKFCYKIIDKVKELKEVSVVEEPADKHARVITFTDKAVTRDFMTWRETKGNSKDSN